MKNLIVIITILFFTNTSAQEFVNDTSKYEQYKIEAGILVPLGNLKSKIGISQQYGFWYRTRIEHNDLMDLGFNIVVPTAENSFAYTGKDSVFDVKARGLGIMMGCRMNKLYSFNLLQKKATIEWNSTFGASFFLFQDKENPEDTSGYYADENGDKSYHIDTNTKSLSSLFVAQGICFTSKNIGIQVNYNFIPYSWFTKRIDNDFGKSSMSIFLNYKL